MVASAMRRGADLAKVAIIAPRDEPCSRTFRSFLTCLFLVDSSSIDLFHQYFGCNSAIFSTEREGCFFKFVSLISFVILSF